MVFKKKNLKRSNKLILQKKSKGKKKKKSIKKKKQRGGDDGPYCFKKDKIGEVFNFFQQKIPNNYLNIPLLKKATFRLRSKVYHRVTEETKYVLQLTNPKILVNDTYYRDTSGTHSKPLEKSISKELEFLDNFSISNDWVEECEPAVKNVLKNIKGVQDVVISGKEINVTYKPYDNGVSLYIFINDDNMISLRLKEGEDTSKENVELSQGFLSEFKKLAKSDLLTIGYALEPSGTGD